MVRRNPDLWPLTNETQSSLSFKSQWVALIKLQFYSIWLLLPRDQPPWQETQETHLNHLYHQANRIIGSDLSNFWTRTLSIHRAESSVIWPHTWLRIFSKVSKLKSPSSTGISMTCFKVLWCSCFTKFGIHKKTPCNLQDSPTWWIQEPMEPGRGAGAGGVGGGGLPQV